MSCKYCDGSGIGYGDELKELCVFENHGHPEIVLPIGSHGSVRADIDYCPKCGRYLKKHNDFAPYKASHGPCTLEIPVPIGGMVWAFWTDCCCACYTKHERPDELSCNFQSPCHTYVTSVRPMTLKYENLSMILEGWGTRFFYTKNEAEDAAEELVEKHRAKMLELGYDVDAEGKIVNFESELKDDE
jgi:hypothetical protein